MSSSKDWAFRIQDILWAIGKIERFVKGLTFSQFKKNELVIDAVLKNLATIGEASRSIPISIKHLHPDIPWEEIYRTCLQFCEFWRQDFEF